MHHRTGCHVNLLITNSSHRAQRTAIITAQLSSDHLDKISFEGSWKDLKYSESKVSDSRSADRSRNSDVIIDALAEYWWSRHRPEFRGLDSGGAAP